MKHDYFYCYDEQLYQLLKRNGQKYICTGLHINTKRQFWQFPKTDTVKEITNLWFSRLQK